MAKESFHVLLGYSYACSPCKYTRRTRCASNLKGHLSDNCSSSVGRPVRYKVGKLTVFASSHLPMPNGNYDHADRLRFTLPTTCDWWVSFTLSFLVISLTDDSRLALIWNVHCSKQSSASPVSKHHLFARTSSRLVATRCPSYSVTRPFKPPMTLCARTSISFVKL
jgi:hypothetical protein